MTGHRLDRRQFALGAAGAALAFRGLAWGSGGTEVAPCPGRLQAARPGARRAGADRHARKRNPGFRRRSRRGQADRIVPQILRQCPLWNGGQRGQDQPGCHAGGGRHRRLRAAQRRRKKGDDPPAAAGAFRHVHSRVRETPAMRAARPARGSHPPGSFWYYNNWDFNVLGEIYQRVTGEGLFTAIEHRLARPLGWQDFDPLRMPNGDRSPNRRASAPIICGCRRATWRGSGSSS